MSDSPRAAVRRPMRVHSASPQLRIPVQPKDLSRRRRVIAALCAAAILAAIAAAAWIYQRNVDPIRARESYDDAVSLYRIARYPQAIMALDRTLALKPGFADAYLLRGRAHAGEGDTEPAIRDFTAVLRLRPSDAQALLLRAGAFMDEKDLQDAIDDSTAALALDPSLSRAYNLRASAIRALGNPQRALEDFNRAVALDPSVDNFYQRAATYQLLGEHRLAIADLSQVIKFRPDEAPAYYARSESRRAIGDAKGAAADHKEGRRINSR